MKPPSRKNVIEVCAIFSVAYLLLEFVIRQDARDATALRARGERVVTTVTAHERRAGGGSRLICDDILSGTTLGHRTFSVRSVGRDCSNATPRGTAMPVVVLPERPEQVWMLESQLARGDESWGQRSVCFIVWGLSLLSMLVSALLAMIRRRRQS